MAKCGCSSSCSCLIQEGDGIGVTGTGTSGNPYVITGHPIVEYSFSISGVLSVQTGEHRLYNDTGQDKAILLVRASVDPAPTGDDAIFNLLKNGVDLFSAGLTVLDGTNTITGIPDISTIWTAGTYITVDVTQVGSTTPGANLTLTVVAQ